MTVAVILGETDAAGRGWRYGEKSPKASTSPGTRPKPAAVSGTIITCPALIDRRNSASAGHPSHAPASSRPSVSTDTASTVVLASGA